MRRLYAKATSKPLTFLPDVIVLDRGCYLMFCNSKLHDLLTFRLYHEQTDLELFHEPRRRVNSA
jgi:hypothetical protein